MKTSDILSFGTLQLTTEKQTVLTNFTKYFSVIDARGTHEGWNVTVSATPFTVETFDGFVGTPHQLPMGSLALNQVKNIERINYINEIDTFPLIKNNGFNIIDNNQPLSVLNADKGYGMGEFEFDFGKDALALTVDSITAKIDKINYPNGVTPYKSTITWNLISGPNM